jgi:hypothetical protein
MIRERSTPLDPAPYYKVLSFQDATLEHRKMKPRKQDVITFKAEKSLVQALEGVPNRSEFIRSAVLAALESACPLCNGTGILTTNQKKHWEEFSHAHALKKCGDCHELHLVCQSLPEGKTHQKKTRRAKSA